MPIDDESTLPDAATSPTDAASAASDAASAASSAASAATASSASEAVSSGVDAATSAATAAVPAMPSEAATAMQAASAAGSLASATDATSAAAGVTDVVGGTGLAPAGTPEVSRAVIEAAGNIPAPPSSPSASSSTATPAPTVGSPAAAVLSVFSGTPEPVTLSFEAPSITSAVWTASSVSVHETLSAAYTIDVSLHADDPDADSSELLGTAVVIHLRRGHLERELAGIVEEVTTGEASSAESLTVSCQIHVVPALALLGYRKNTRMFWDKDVVEILKEVLESPLSELERTVEFEVERTLPKCEYRMQYDESDFAFAQRLIGEEGLFYYFVTKDGAEILVIADDASKYRKVEGEDADRVPYASSDNSDGHEAVTGFRRTDVVRANKMSLRHWDWSKANLQTSDAAADSDPAYPDTVGLKRAGEREIYEHDSRPITFDQYSDGSGYGTNDTVEQAKIRRQQYLQSARSFHGESTCTGLSVGTVFELTKHPDPSFDQEYVIVSIGHTAYVGDAAQASGAVAELEATYSNHFTCVPAALTYRAPNASDKPRIRGIVTARVVGASGDEIHTDSVGRVKVQFHWDRTSQLDAQGACFIRVAQMMAGQGWGSFFLPRVGMEVIVQFLDGDPDRPLITGAVYNGENPPPYALTDQATRSGFKSRSSVGGGEEDYNELTFEDKKGEEQIILHAQKDLNENIENAHSTTVGGGQTNSVGGDRSVSVSGKQTVSVSKEEEYTVTLDRTTKVDGNDSLTVKAGQTYTLTLGASSITITDGKIEMTTGGATLTMDGSVVDLKSHDGGQVYLTGDALMQAVSGSKVKLDANADLKASGGGQVYLTGDALIQSAVGSSAKMDTNATVSGVVKAELTGINAEVNGTALAKLAVPGAQAEATPGGMTVGGPMVTVQGSGMVTISGPVVSVN